MGARGFLFGASWVLSLSEAEIGSMIELGMLAKMFYDLRIACELSLRL